MSCLFAVVYINLFRPLPETDGRKVSEWVTRFKEASEMSSLSLTLPPNNRPAKRSWIMADKKLGRPTDSPKDITMKIRFDKDTSERHPQYL